MRTYNTGETEAELRQAYNPDGSALRRAQMRMLDMLVFLENTCRSLGISFRLDGGNVLGAVRHGGFIPWDDDVDVVLNRRDYKKLRRHLIAHPHPQYVFHGQETDPNYFTPWGTLVDLKSECESSWAENSPQKTVYDRYKYKGIRIDLFCYEPYAMPRLQRLAAKMTATNMVKVASRSVFCGRIVYKTCMNWVFPLFRCAGRVFGKRDIYLPSYGTWFYFQLPKDVLLPHKPIAFEGHTFEGPANADGMLRLIYGEYMLLPPKEKRAVHTTRITISD
ncbi:MAG: LicD family protein [Prevotella sp.]|nr:LicD family protein [Prevotella sp.]